MTKEIKVSVFVNKHYYQESSSRRTYGDILDNRYSILLDKSATITVMGHKTKRAKCVMLISGEMLLISVG